MMAETPHVCPDERHACPNPPPPAPPVQVRTGAHETYDQVMDHLAGAAERRAVIGRGRVLHMPEIRELTGMADGTIRSRYHGGTMPCVWKLGRRLVAWESELVAWLDDERARAGKVPPPQA
jgi:predicted DNA-binding transcriptional regulator AlpA